MNERDRALMEGHRNAATESYFKARPVLDLRDIRRAYESAYAKAWEDCSALAPAPAAKPAPLTEEQIVAIWQSMPGGPEGWLKQFGFLQFARAVEAKVRAALASAPAANQGAWTHKKSGGQYRLIGKALIQSDAPLSDLSPVVVYQGEDGALWARAAAEFRARFNPTTAAPTQDTAPARVMADCTPPATSRDKWFYEQGRLAERDPRTHAAETAQPAAGAVPNLRARLGEAHDASLDDDHRACRSILMECIRLLDATPPTAQPAEQADAARWRELQAYCGESYQDILRDIDARIAARTSQSKGGGNVE